MGADFSFVCMCVCVLRVTLVSYCYDSDSQLCMQSYIDGSLRTWMREIIQHIGITSRNSVVLHRSTAAKNRVNTHYEAYMRRIDRSSGLEVERS